MIITRALTKRYGRVLAVDRVDLDVREGDRYGFLGPNGSGKTTVVRMLLGLVYATSGEIEVMGRPVPSRVAEVLPRIGALVEGPSCYGHLSGRANLALIDASGRGRGLRSRRKRIAEALERVGLAGVDNRAVKKYSLGMRQRLGLAAALLREPRLLVLDEPTNGLDPQGIREIRDLLTELNKAGTTVFLSSHQLSEVEQLCTRVGIVDRGRLVLQDDLDTLRAPTGRVMVRTPDAERAAALLDGRLEQRDGDQLLVAAMDPADLNARLVAAGLRVIEIGPERRSLEALMLAVTGSGSDRIDRVRTGTARPTAAITEVAEPGGAVNRGTAGARAVERSAGGAHAVDRGAGGARAVERSAGGAHAVERGAGGARGVEHGAGGARAVERSAGGAHAVDRGAGGARAVERSAGGAHAVDRGAGGARPVEREAGEAGMAERGAGKGGEGRTGAESGKDGKSAESGNSAESAGSGNSAESRPGGESRSGERRKGWDSGESRKGWEGGMAGKALGFGQGGKGDSEGERREGEGRGGEDKK
jgi:ABC-type multidrug transport system ATPase subunit